MGNSPAAGPPDEVHALLEGREAILNLNANAWCFWASGNSPLQRAARCAEALGFDDLADWYANAADRYPTACSISRWACLSVRARVQSRRGERDAALLCRRSAEV